MEYLIQSWSLPFTNWFEDNWISRRLNWSRNVQACDGVKQKHGYAEDINITCIGLIFFELDIQYMDLLRLCFFILTIYIASQIICESPPQFENRIMARVYVRSITRSTLYKKLHFVSQNWRMEN